VTGKRHAVLKRILIGAGAPLGLAVAALGGALVLGGPDTPPPLAFIRDETVARDRSDLPPLRRYRARDGVELGYRMYPAANPVGAAVLIHGSVGSSADVHEIAKAVRDAGISTYAPDIRGHGASGRRGDIAYIGQLDDDMADFLAELDRQGVPAQRLLIGHSAGGGFALRLAARPLGRHFTGAILLAPFLGDGAPTNRPGIGGWVRVGRPRIVALSLLDDLGIHVFDGLPAVAFAVAPRDAPYVTPVYSFRLAANFGPDRDWHADIAAARIPLVVLVGDADQVFFPDRYPQALAAAADARVEILPGIDHMGIGGDAAALDTLVMRVRQMLTGKDHP
jgi:alpha-beta hydrolase superfamily lysophospholipase